ncbi:hypothetical protein [Niallia endozanthoxylica]|uniref:Uncharacterized protein n=1 Tax=Niallia endozanthoxylica TaxID=2036016 RepID=A0A5J5HUY0_9BACI|nr:hypothetical protein [Niallia endozanthoxylica]KAA9026175.1 hypothetical protein F4V44_09895 [Niallia endozanthoxylica]
MLIKSSSGYELQKEKPNTSEDFFNRSELLIEENGKERVFHVLYLRYFEENLQEYTPFQQNPIFRVGTRDIELKDMAALACFIKHPEYRNRKRVYIKEPTEFSSCFEGLDIDKLMSLFQELEDKKSSVFRSHSDFIRQ